LPSIALGDIVRRRVFVTITFARWLRKSLLSEQDLCDAVAEMAAGLVGVDLGGHLFKKRVASPGRGKSGSARVLVGTNLGDRWFFLFGFEKKERDNINDRELAALQKLAGSSLKKTEHELVIDLERGNLAEIFREEKSHTE
jgi:hypothetical protein